MTITPEEAAAEEARARLWRDEQVRRVAYQQGLWQALAGSPAARDALMASWQPLIDYRLEREQPDIDPQEEIDPLGISDQVNVGT